MTSNTVGTIFDLPSQYPASIISSLLLKTLEVSLPSKTEHTMFEHLSYHWSEVTLPIPPRFCYLNED